MDYLLCTAAVLIGIFFHVMQKITTLHDKFKELPFKTIWATFFQQEWDSLMVSAVILMAYLLFLFTANYNGIIFTNWFDKWGMYVLALVIGYAGQRLAYKYLKTAEKILEKKAERLTDSNG